MGIFVYPLLRRLKLFTAVSRIIYVRLDFSLLRSFSFTFVHSPRLGTWITWSTEFQIGGNFPASRFTDIFPFLKVSTFFFSSPLLLAITFQFSAIPHGRQTLPLLPLSTLLHFACQLLSVVAKVISSVSCSSFRGKHILLAVLLFLSLSGSLFSRFLLRILPPAVGISFNRRTSHAAQKPAVLPLTLSSQPAPFIKACSPRCFFPPLLLLH